MKRWRALYYIGVIGVTLAYFGLLFKSNLISADVFVGKEGYSRKYFDATIDGQNAKFEIETHKEGDKYIHTLYARKNLLEKADFKLTGFDEDIFLCSSPVVGLGSNYGQALCFVGNVGAHSRNIQLIKYDGQKFSETKIMEGTSQNVNIYSDVPNFLVEDYNTDGITDLIVDFRNYEKDSIDAIRNYFRGTVSGFVFDKKENIIYDQNEN